MPGDEARDRHAGVERRPPPPLRRIEVHDERRRPHVRDVDEQHAGDPRPLGRRRGTAPSDDRARARSAPSRRTPRDRSVPRTASASRVLTPRDLARRAQAVVERLLEQRESREIGVREVDACRSARAREPRRRSTSRRRAAGSCRGPRTRPRCARRGRGRRGARARDPRAIDLGPVRVAGAGEPLAHRARIGVGERVVPGPHRRAAIAAALVRRATRSRGSGCRETRCPTPAARRGRARAAARAGARSRRPTRRSRRADRLAAPRRARSGSRRSSASRRSPRRARIAERAAGPDRDQRRRRRRCRRTATPRLDRRGRVASCATSAPLPSGHVTTVCAATPGPRWRAAK